MAGPRYLKAQFNEYTDETFTTKRARSAEDAYMGILGPVIRAEVGDTVDVSRKTLEIFYLIFRLPRLPFLFPFLEFLLTHFFLYVLQLFF